MKQEMKEKIIGSLVVLFIIGLVLDYTQKNKKVKEPVKKERLQGKELEKTLNLITDLQDHFYNKKLTKEMLEKYPSFNKITKDFRPLGKNIYYLYSKKYNIELQVKNNEVTWLQEGSRWKN